MHGLVQRVSIRNRLTDQIVLQREGLAGLSTNGGVNAQVVRTAELDQVSGSNGGRGFSFLADEIALECNSIACNGYLPPSFFFSQYGTVSAKR